MDKRGTITGLLPRSFFFEEKNITRAGIIPYSFNAEGKRVVLLGLKSNYQKYLGDFGGGCKGKETPLSCLKREFTEELNGILDINLETAILSSETIMTVYLTKEKTKNIYWVEFFIKVDYDPNIDAVYADADYKGITEHIWIDWFSSITFEKIDGSLKPFFPAIKQFLSLPTYSND